MEGSICGLSCPEKWELIPQRIAEYDNKTNISRAAAVNSMTVTCDSSGNWLNSLNFLSDISLTWGCEPISCLPLEDLSLGGNFNFVRVSENFCVTVVFLFLNVIIFVFLAKG